jgi:NhaP-type Na+/H+ or K+/H+ antiporter
MLQRVVLMSAGWLIMSLLLAGMTIPVLTTPAHATKATPRADIAADAKAARQTAGETPTPAQPAQPAVSPSAKPVTSEPPKPVTVINQSEDAVRHQQRANRTLVDEGEEAEIRPETAAAMTIVKDGATEPAKTEQTAPAVSPSVSAKPTPKSVSRGPREYSNGVVCLAGCD